MFEWTPKILCSLPFFNAYSELKSVELIQTRIEVATMLLRPNVHILVRFLCSKESQRKCQDSSFKEQLVNHKVFRAKNGRNACSNAVFFPVKLLLHIPLREWNFLDTYSYKIWILLWLKYILKKLDAVDLWLHSVFSVASGIYILNQSKIVDFLGYQCF